MSLENETVPETEGYGWMKRFDELHADPNAPMAAPWHWEVHDYSAATLCGGGEDSIVGHIMTVSPCGSCIARAKAGDARWQWGRCCTPAEPNARLIAAAPALLCALKEAEARLRYAGLIADDGDPVCVALGLAAEEKDAANG